MTMHSHLTACSFVRWLARSAAALLFVSAFSGLVSAQDGQAPASRLAPAPIAAQRPPDGDGDSGGLLPEPRFISHGINRVVDTFHVFDEGNGSPGKNGFYPEFSNMITGSGMVSAGPGYRKNLFGDQAFFDVSS